MIKLELPDQMVAIIGECLGNGPHKIVAPVITEIQKQIDAQQPMLNGGHDTTMPDKPHDHLG